MRRTQEAPAAPPESLRVSCLTNGPPYPPSVSPSDSSAEPSYTDGDFVSSSSHHLKASVPLTSTASHILHTPLETSAVFQYPYFLEYTQP